MKKSLSYNFENMNIFVVIVTFNGSKWLDKCVGRLRTSTIPVIPIVVDNNSSDDTVKIIKAKYPEVTLLESKENLGFGKANNIGIEYGLKNESQYFFLLNQDAWIFPDTIEKLVNVNIKNPEYFILSPLHLNGHENSLDKNFSHFVSAQYCDDLLSDLALKKNLNEVYPLKFVNAAFWLLSKECVMKIGGFDSLFSHYGEDDDYINRIHFHGYRVGICPNSLGIHDRNQEPYVLESQPKEKRINRKTMIYLIDLKNINSSFFTCVLKSIKRAIEKSLKSLQKKNFCDSLLEIKIFLILLYKFKSIKRHRNLSRIGGLQFFNLNEKSPELLNVSNYLNKEKAITDMT